MTSIDAPSVDDALHARYVKRLRRSVELWESRPENAETANRLKVEALRSMRLSAYPKSKTALLVHELRYLLAVAALPEHAHWPSLGEFQKSPA
jgi:hypothetical protein